VTINAVVVDEVVRAVLVHGLMRNVPIHVARDSLEMMFRRGSARNKVCKAATEEASLWMILW
jgi:hypothetical protein